MLLCAVCCTAAYLVWRVHSKDRFISSSVVTQVEKLSRLVTVRYRIQRVVGLKEAKQPFGEESILLMVEGEVQAGVDLQKVTEKDVRWTGAHSFRLSVPPPVIFNSFLDEGKTKVWDRQITWWTPWVPFDPDLEHKARLEALDDVRRAALGMGILDEAAKDAQSAIRDFFGALGFTVEVKSRSLD